MAGGAIPNVLGTVKVARELTAPMLEREKVPPTTSWGASFPSKPLSCNLFSSMAISKIVRFCSEERERERERERELMQSEKVV